MDYANTTNAEFIVDPKVLVLNREPVPLMWLNTGDRHFKGRKFEYINTVAKSM